MQFAKNKDVNILLAPIAIKSLPDGTKFVCSLIAPRSKEGDFYDEWKFVSRHCENGSSQIQGVGFYQYYSPVAHDDYFRTNITFANMHSLNARILDVINDFQNKNVLIYERVCVSPPPYYLDWFEKSYPNVSLNRDEGIFYFNV